MQQRDDDFSVASLLEFVVLPAVAQVLNHGELEALGLGPGAWGGAELEETPDRFWLSLRAVGETFHLSLDAEPLRNVGWDGMRRHLADELRTFVAESRFGWGQDR